MSKVAVETTPPFAVMMIVALFLVAIGYVLAASVVRRSQPTFAPSPVDPRPVEAGRPVYDTITIDAREQRTWQFVNFDRRSVVSDTTGWDIAVRRFYVIAAGGLIDLGKVAFDSVTVVPESGYILNVAAGDTTNPAIRRWYRYSYLSHLLEPEGHVYAVKTRDRRYATIEILSYYCPGLVAGCVTIRYRYPVRSR